jgi:hypothetical protein
VRHDARARAELRGEAWAELDVQRGHQVQRNDGRLRHVGGEALQLGTAAKRGLRSLRIWRLELGDSPMLWKELFAERPVFTLGVIGLIAQTLLFLGVLIPAVVIFINRMRYGGGGMFEELEIYVIGVGTTVACVGFLVVAVRAASSVTAERERQTWDVLMSTPIDPWEVVRAVCMPCVESCCFS